MEASELVLALFSSVMTAVVGALATAVKIHRERERKADAKFDAEHVLLLQGMRALMKSELFRLHAEYVQVGKPVPLDIKEQANSVHEVYAGLGGNGVGTHLWRELMDAHASETKEDSDD
ncbi:MAG: hypothetical protein MR415_02450 [Coriobacteriaceae bacterium]|nr:hypothetical protein [Coriobacteriaceae bacterium]MCI6547489.1 hypothetical protein [Coriobacteriaceae bacterium]